MQGASNDGVAKVGLADRNNTRPTRRTNKHKTQVGKSPWFDAATRSPRELGGRRRKIERGCAAGRLTAATFFKRSARTPRPAPAGPFLLPFDLDRGLPEKIMLKPETASAEYSRRPIPTLPTTHEPRPAMQTNNSDKELWARVK